MSTAAAAAAAATANDAAPQPDMEAKAKPDPRRFVTQIPPGMHQVARTYMDLLRHGFKCGPCKTEAELVELLHNEPSLSMAMHWPIYRNEQQTLRKPGRTNDLDRIDSVLELIDSPGGRLALQALLYRQGRLLRHGDSGSWSESVEWVTSLPQLHALACLGLSGDLLYLVLVLRKCRPDDITKLDSRGFTALYHAVTVGPAKSIKYLAVCAPELAKVRDSMGRQAISYLQDDELYLPHDTLEYVRTYIRLFALSVDKGWHTMPIEFLNRHIDWFDRCVGIRYKGENGYRYAERENLKSVVSLLLAMGGIRKRAEKSGNAG